MIIKKMFFFSTTKKEINRAPAIIIAAAWAILDQRNKFSGIICQTKIILYQTAKFFFISTTQFGMKKDVVTLEKTLYAFGLWLKMWREDRISARERDRNKENKPLRKQWLNAQYEPLYCH